MLFSFIFHTCSQFFPSATQKLRIAQKTHEYKTASEHYASFQINIILDFLVGKSTQTVKDKSMLARLEDIANLPTTKRLEVFNVIDAYIRDFKTSKAYATK